MSVYHLVLLLILVMLIGGVLVLFLPAQRSRIPPGSPADRQLADPVFRDDDQYWYGGFFYNNPNDPDPVVPKRYGYGWTVNFGHPLGKLFIAIMVAMILLPIVLAIFVPGLPATGCHPSSGCHLAP